MMINDFPKLWPLKEMNVVVILRFYINITNICSCTNMCILVYVYEVYIYKASSVEVNLSNIYHPVKCVNISFKRMVHNIMQIYAYYSLNHIMQIMLKIHLRRSFKKVLFHRFRRLEFDNDISMMINDFPILWPLKEINVVVILRFYINITNICSCSNMCILVYVYEVYLYKDSSVEVNLSNIYHLVKCVNIRFKRMVYNFGIKRIILSKFILDIGSACQKRDVIRQVIYALCVS